MDAFLMGFWATRCRLRFVSHYGAFLSGISSSWMRQRNRRLEPPVVWPPPTQAPAPSPAAGLPQSRPRWSHNRQREEACALPLPRGHSRLSAPLAASAFDPPSRHRTMEAGRGGGDDGLLARLTYCSRRSAKEGSRNVWTTRTLVRWPISSKTAENVLFIISRATYSSNPHNTPRSKPEGIKLKLNCLNFCSSPSPLFCPSVDLHCDFAFHLKLKNPHL